MTSSFTPVSAGLTNPRAGSRIFVRVSWQGQIFSGFFADKKYGGCEQALATAQKFYLTLRKKLGKPAQRSRRWNAEVVRRKGGQAFRASSA